MSTTFNRSLIERFQADAKESVTRLNRLVAEMLPAGTEVEYNYGGRWIGPCQVNYVDRFSWSYNGPGVGVTNLRTGKSRHICSIDYIRPLEHPSCTACGSVPGQHHSPECPAVNAFTAGRIPAALNVEGQGGEE